MNKVIILSVIFFITSCDFISPEKETDTFISINPEKIDTTKYDEIRIVAINENTEDTIPLHTWEKGEDFPNEIQIPGSVDDDFKLHFIGIEDGKVVSASEMEVSKDDDEIDSFDTIYELLDTLPTPTVSEIHDKTVQEGSTVKLNPYINFVGDYDVFWIKEDSVISTDSTLQFTDFTNNHAGEYQFLLINKRLKDTVSQAFELKFTEDKIKLKIMNDLDSLYKAEVGDTLILQAGFEGIADEFQWFKDGDSISAGTSSFLVLHDLRQEDAGEYHLKLTDDERIVSTRTAILDVHNKLFSIRLDEISGPGSVVSDGCSWPIILGEGESIDFRLLPASFGRIEAVYIDSIENNESFESKIISIKEIEKDISIIVRFDTVFVRIEAVSSDSTMGKVWVRDNKNNFKADTVSSARLTAKLGDTLFVSAFASIGHTFSHWEPSGTEYPDSVLFVTEDISLKAVFLDIRFNVRATVNNPNYGTVEVSDEQPELDDEVTITATPKEGYVFIGWDGREEEDPILTVSPADDIEVKALFERKSLTLELGTNPTEGGNTTGGGTVKWGVATDIVAVPNDGFIFNNWAFHSDDRNWDGTVEFGNGHDSSTTLTLSGGNAFVRANFDRKEYSLSIEKYFSDSKSVISVLHGISNEISASELDSAEFNHWTVLSGSAVFADSFSMSTSVILYEGDAAIQPVYALKPRVESVRFEPEGFRFEGSTMITFLKDNRADVYYTTDGSEPTSNSNYYHAPFEISSSATVKAIAIRGTNYRPSLITSETYIKNTHPTLSITSPLLTSDSILITDNPLTVTGRAKDDAEGFSVTASLDGSDIDVEDQESFSFDVSLVPGRWSQLEVEITDSNATKASRNVWVYRRYDFGTIPAPLLDSTTYTKIFLSWAPVDGAEYYIIFRGGQVLDTIQSTTYFDVGLSGGTVYDYSLKVYNTGPLEAPIIDISDMGATASHSTMSGFLSSLGDEEFDVGNDIQQTDDGGFLVLCYRASHFGRFDPKILLVKLDSNGIYQSQRAHEYNITLDRMRMERDSDGNFIISATGNPDKGSHSKIILLKVDQSGAKIWSSLIYIGSSMVSGGMRPISSGYIMSGYYTTSDGDTDGIIMRMDAAGDTVWTKRYTGVGDDKIFDVEYAEERIFYTGSTTTGAAETEDLVWGYYENDGGDGTRTLVSHGGREKGSSIRLHNGSLYITGQFSIDICRIKLNPSDLGTYEPFGSSIIGGPGFTTTALNNGDISFSIHNSINSSTDIITYSRSLEKISTLTINVSDYALFSGLRTLSDGTVIGAGVTITDEGRAQQVLVFKGDIYEELPEYFTQNDLF